MADLIGLQNCELTQNTEKKFRCLLVRFGFDFTLIGTIYLFELLNEIHRCSRLLKKTSLPTMTLFADKHNIKIKTYNRVIRWSIKKAFRSGGFYKVDFFENRTNTPPTMQVISWLYNFYLINYDLDLPA